MRAWALPEDLTDAQRCVKFLQSDKALQQQLGVQMVPRVAMLAHAQVLPLAMAKVQAMRDDVEYVVMSGEAFKECVEECEQLLSTPVAARQASRCLHCCLHCCLLTRCAACVSSCGTSPVTWPFTSALK